METELVDHLTFRLGTGSLRGPVFVRGVVCRYPHAQRGLPGSGICFPGPGQEFVAGLTRDGLSISAAAEPEQESGIEQREAYEIFQRARHEWQTFERHRMQDGLQHLLRATELDPSLIGARVDLANLSVTQSLYGFMSPAVAADIVRRTAESIPDLSRAEAILPALGWVRFHVDRNLTAALWAFSLSAHLPHDPWITRVRSMFVLSRHRFGEAIDLLRAAILLDPYSPWLQARLAWALHLARATPSRSMRSRKVPTDATPCSFPNMKTPTSTER